MRTVAVFDMDGTLTDSRQAIWRSYRYAARKLGVPVPDDTILSQHLCGGLPDNCLALFGEEHAEEAVRYYREDYLSHNADDDVTLSRASKRCSRGCIPRASCWGWRP
jgi:phosphoglycolate phosphatase-like HAD superfamily hydrolase